MTPSLWVELLKGKQGSHHPLDVTGAAFFDIREQSCGPRTSPEYFAPVAYQPSWMRSFLNKITAWNFNQRAAQERTHEDNTNQFQQQDSPEVDDVWPS